MGQYAYPGSFCDFPVGAYGAHFLAKKAIFQKAKFFEFLAFQCALFWPLFLAKNRGPKTQTHPRFIFGQNRPQSPPPLFGQKWDFWPILGHFGLCRCFLGVNSRLSRLFWPLSAPSGPKSRRRRGVNFFRFFAVFGEFLFFGFWGPIFFVLMKNSVFLLHIRSEWFGTLGFYRSDFQNFGKKGPTVHTFLRPSAHGLRPRGVLGSKKVCTVGPSGAYVPFFRRERVLGHLFQKSVHRRHLFGPFLVFQRIFIGLWGQVTPYGVTIMLVFHERA